MCWEIRYQELLEIMSASSYINELISGNQSKFNQMSLIEIAIEVASRSSNGRPRRHFNSNLDQRHLINYHLITALNYH